MPVIRGGKVMEGVRHRGPAGMNASGSLGPFSNNGAPTGSTLSGQADKGALLIDTSSGVLYINTGTLSSPTWTVVGTQTTPE